MTDVLDAFSLGWARPSPNAEGHPRLREIDGFGANPGQLKMHLYAPPGRSKHRPLVVVLHGCTQTAAGFDDAAGWSALAERRDFLVLYPEQQRGNNRHLCFSWFDPAKTQRGRGEVESIREMIAYAITSCGADRKRIHICGLSAGGAMANAMLATHPELFKSGAILAGLPYGIANNLPEAVEAMSRGRVKDARQLGDLVRAASGREESARKGRRESWPHISVWHGTADTVVRPINGGEIVKQWTNVLGLGDMTPREDTLGAATRRVWQKDEGGASVVEYTVPGLGHGVPIDQVDPPAPFFLPAALSATHQIASDWGLARRKRAGSLLALLGI